VVLVGFTPTPEGCTDDGFFLKIDEQAGRSREEGSRQQEDQLIYVGCIPEASGVRARRGQRCRERR
jgi:hypothetical protein